MNEGKDRQWNGIQNSEQDLTMSGNFNFDKGGIMNEWMKGVLFTKLFGDK